ncbi:MULTISPECIES: TolC family protein [unclassified Marinobacterium]|uniref:TolC family protein n=1 Tax=unclassified Marinobacterium TaxID=2644139 RepID=UPI001569532A|nr:MULTISPECIES: TolC family protein [unclassified Marinobacterium]NRP46000.1 Outer membrane protein TolC precursor [Marinobacterium sp. xm-d-543]NRQ22340.1 Outer membrane protein TolC precursor [Marinobacterium sp. xm-m-312]
MNFFFMIRLILLKVIIFSTPLVFAQDSISLKHFAVDLSSLYSEAIKNAPDILSTEAAVRREEALRSAALGKLLPQISVQSNLSKTRYKNSLTSTDYTGRKSSLTLTQSIFDAPSYFAFSKADLSIVKANNTAEAAKLDLAIQITQGYFDILEYEEQSDLINAQVEVLEKSLVRINSLLEKKLATKTDMLSVKAKLDAQRADLIEQKNQALLSREALSELIGRTVDEPLKPIDSAASLVELGSRGTLEQILNRAYIKNPEVAAKKAALESQRESLYEARSSHLPKLSLQASAEVSNIGYANAPTNTTESGVIGLTLSIPIFSGGSTEARADANREAITIAEQDLEAAQRKLKKNIKLSYLGIKSAKSRIIASLAAVNSAKQALYASEKTFEFGLTNVVEVANKSAEHYRSLIQLNKAKYDLVRNYLALEALSGGLLNDDLETVNALLK